MAKHGTSALSIAAVFAASLAFNLFLCSAAPRLLVAIIALSSLGVVAAFVRAGDYSFDAAGALVKLLCEWTFGLGAVTFYGTLSPETQARHLDVFTLYVNAAVLGNIGMMVAVPTGSTARGWSHRAACMLLCYWLVRECRQARWRTVEFRDGVFVFTASPLAWILAHAAYRAVMMTLPMFETKRYRILEPASLGGMSLLHALHGRPGESPALFFGASDTLVVSTIAFATWAVSAMWPTRGLRLSRRQSEAWDGVLVGVHLAVCWVALQHVVQA